MKHKMTSEDLLRLCNWFRRFRRDVFICDSSRRHWELCHAEEQENGDVFSVTDVEGTPDECAAFLLAEWRKSKEGE